MQETYTYEILKNSLNQEIIKRTDSEGKELYIPTDLSNTDYQTYKKQLEESE